MKNKDFVILCLRLLSIYFIILGLSSLPNLISVFVEDIGAPFFVGATPVLFLICGGALYFLAPKISRYIIDFSNAEEGEVRTSPSEKTARIALLVLGVFVFVHALPQFVKSAVDTGIYYIELYRQPPELRNFTHRWTYLIAPVLQLLLSIFLIIGPDKLLGMLSKYDSTFERIHHSKRDYSEK